LSHNHSSSPAETRNRLPTVAHRIRDGAVADALKAAQKLAQ
jgi:hypothetical protein